MIVPKIYLALGIWQKKLSRMLLMWVFFSDASISARKNGFYFVHVTGAVFTF